MSRKEDISDAAEVGGLIVLQNIQDAQQHPHPGQQRGSGEGLHTFHLPAAETHQQLTHLLAMSMGLVGLVEVAFDGTRVKANASRLHTWTAERVEAALAELEPQIEKLLQEADAHRRDPLCDHQEHF